MITLNFSCCKISIHAPSRERLTQPSLADQTFAISIHAPSRERLTALLNIIALYKFQSTLPHGSDKAIFRAASCFIDFNPRSLTGATQVENMCGTDYLISIHAPSRERQLTDKQREQLESISIHAPSRERHLNRKILA